MSTARERVIEIAQSNGIDLVDLESGVPSDVHFDPIIDLIADLRQAGVVTMAEATALTLCHISDQDG